MKGYAAHEKETLDRVIQARNGAVRAKTIDDKIAAENQLVSALAGLKITLEAYPDLKANQNFLQLQEEIADVENKLAAVRRYFNSATKEYNNAVQTFPSNIVARNDRIPKRNHVRPKGRMNVRIWIKHLK